MIISLLNQKGGVGKTTIAVHIAFGLHQKGKRVLLVDADPQGSSLSWVENREGESPFQVIGMAKSILHKELPKLRNDYDFIVIDGPPRVYDVARSAALASDIILIPVQPSPYDVWATEEIIKIIQDVRSFNDHLKAFFVISRKLINTVIGREVESALSKYELPVMKAQISNRVGFAESAGEGKTVLETDPRGNASEEILALISELLKEGR